MDSVLVQVGRAIGIACVETLAFPWWWYRHGLPRVLAWAGRAIRGWERSVGLRLWAQHLFVPMFGQTDWQGRIISFAMRLSVLVGRMLQVVVGAFAVLITLVGYILLPPFVIAQAVLAFVM